MVKGSHRRKSMLRSILLALAFFAFPLAASAAGKPTVLIVMTDDQGLGDFSYTGNPVLKTPNLDAFARRSVRLTDFHAAPMCSPTRGQLLTGLAALRNGATAVTAGRTFMRPGLPTLPEVFAKAGYRTGIFGKWHLGDNHPHRPTDRGFHESVYHKGWGQLLSIAEVDTPLIGGRYFHNGAEKRCKGHCTDFWFDSAMAWMKRCKSRNEPLFCYLPTNAPHDPHIDLEEYIRPYRKPGVPAAFFGMIAHIDKRFGDLEKFLDEQQLKDDTIVLPPRSPGEDLQRRAARRQDQLLRGRAPRAVLDSLAGRQAGRAARRQDADAEHRPAADAVRALRRRGAEARQGR